MQQNPGKFHSASVTAVCAKGLSLTLDGLAGEGRTLHVTLNTLNEVTAITSANATGKLSGLWKPVPISKSH